jgi:hypothetical protein
MGKFMNPKKNLNAMFISEHVIERSHADHLAMGIKECLGKLFCVDYTKLFHEYGRNGLLERLKNYIKSQDIGLVFVNLGSSGIFTPDLAVALKRVSQIRLSEHNFEEQDRYYAQIADLNWVMNPSVVDLFKMYGFGVFQGFGLHQSLLNPNVSDIEKCIDVSFIGGIYRSNRSNFLDKLLEDGIKIEVYGAGTKRGRVTDLQRDQIIRKSKIHLNFTGVQNNRLNIFKLIKQNKARNIEVAFLGTFLLTEYAHGIESILNINEGADTFCNYDELLSKIKYYLANEDVREGRAALQKAETIAKNNSTEVAKKMLTALSAVEIDLNLSHYYVDKIFTNWLGFIVAHHVGFFLGSLKFKFFFNECRYYLQHCTPTKNCIIQLMRGFRLGLMSLK